MWQRLPLVAPGDAPLRAGCWPLPLAILGNVPKRTSPSTPLTTAELRTATALCKEFGVPLSLVHHSLERDLCVRCVGHLSRQMTARGAMDRAPRERAHQYCGRLVLSVRCRAACAVPGRPRPDRSRQCRPNRRHERGAPSVAKKRPPCARARILRTYGGVGGPPSSSESPVAAAVAQVDSPKPAVARPARAPPRPPRASSR